MKIAKIAKNIINNKKNNIALIGHMGSGKSLLGKLIAKNLNFHHLDSDKLIENKLNKPIYKIFEDSGEQYFRKIEENIILNIGGKNDIVLSLGGGSILSAKVRNLLKKKFFSVFLDVDINILNERLKKTEHRPLLMNINVINKIKELDKLRRNYYLLSDIILKDHISIKNTIMEFNKKYKKFYEKNN